MDPDKILKFIADNLADWSRIIVHTLIRPRSEFGLVEVTAEGCEHLVSGGKQGHRWISPRLVTFVAFSVLAGLAMNGLLRGHGAAPQLFATVVTVVVAWFFYATAAHLLCAAMRGRGSYLETLNSTLQVLAVVYVVVSFFTLMICSVAAQPTVAPRLHAVPILGANLIEDPGLLFFLSGAVMLSFYIPLALRGVHGFGWIRTGAIGLLPYLLAGIFIQIHHYTGIFFNR